jgi:hypothetical protein
MKKKRKFIKNKLLWFTKNPFLTLRVSKYRLDKFVADHLSRTKGRNNPAYAQIILSTQALYDSIFGSIAARDRNYNEQQGFTIMVNQKIKEFKTKVLEMESLVCVKFKKKSPTWEEFYPHGRTEYYRVNKSNILLLFERIIHLTTTYESELGSDLKTEFTQMYEDFEPVFARHLQLKGAVAGFASSYEVLKMSLCTQLYKNLLTILVENPEEPEKVFACFDGTIVGWAKVPKKRKKIKTTE